MANQPGGAQPPPQAPQPGGVQPAPQLADPNLIAVLQALTAAVHQLPAANAAAVTATIPAPPAATQAVIDLFVADRPFDRSS